MFFDTVIDLICCGILKVLSLGEAKRAKLPETALRCRIYNYINRTIRNRLFMLNATKGENHRHIRYEGINVLQEYPSRNRT